MFSNTRNVRGVRGLRGVLLKEFKVFIRGMLVCSALIKRFRRAHDSIVRDREGRPHVRFRHCPRSVPLIFLLLSTTSNHMSLLFNVNDIVVISGLLFQRIVTRNRNIQIFNECSFKLCLLNEFLIMRSDH